MNFFWFGFVGNVVWMDQIMAARAMLKMSTDRATSKDNGADSADIDVQKDTIDGNLFHCCNCKCVFI